MPDIDIDFADRETALKLFKHIPAMRIDAGESKKHNTGVYLQKVPYDPLSGLCSLDHKEADKKDYFKLDFLNVSIYNGVRSEEHLVELMNKEPLWDLLEQEDFVNLLFHINGHANICQIMKPKNVEQLAAILGIIRPAKRHLLGKSWKEVFDQVWEKPTDNTYYFKKSHATAYAVAIIVQMNLICEQLNS